MLSMSINHPDIEEFITKKQDLTKVTGANISVKVTDEFMKAVEKDEDYILRFPINTSIPKDLMIDEMDYNDSELWIYQEGGENTKLFKKVKARELWDKLMHCAWNTAEPGILFEDTMHDYAPDGAYPDFKMVSTNPCGEIPMGAFDSCRLMHINLSSYVTDPFTSNATINEDLLYRHSYEAMRLADDLIDLEIESIDKIIDTVKYDNNLTEYKLWSSIKDTTTKGRRAGLGFTGLADAIAMLGLKYDSDEGIQKVEHFMKIMFKGHLDSTIDMAIERGSFPAWNKNSELFDGELDRLNGGNKWFKFLCKNYPYDTQRMSKHGRRNISWSTVKIAAA